MLNYKIIELKPEVTKNNETFIDLMADTYNTNVTPLGYPLIVNKYYVGRPDLISLAIYGDDRYGDIICKLNGISNPFELNEDDVLFIPSFTYLDEFIKKYRTPSDFIEDEKTETIQKKDPNNYQKRKNETRSPNEQTIGDSNFIIDKSLGIVFY